VARFAAEEGVLFVVEEQAAADFGGVGGVAFVAVFDEDGADVLFEERGLLRGGLGGQRWQSSEQKEGKVLRHGGCVRVSI
jgi:hypothetical protein